MGGLGLGRRSGHAKRTVEECVAIDVNRWNGLGLLLPGRSFGRTWTVEGEPVLTVNVTVRLRSLVLCHAGVGEDRKAAHVCYEVPTWWTPCRFGGQRPWLHCPCCGRRVVKLYLVGGSFRCRPCGGLVYASQRAGSLDRVLDRLASAPVTIASLLEHRVPRGPAGSTASGPVRRST